MLWVPCPKAAQTIKFISRWSGTGLFVSVTLHSVACFIIIPKVGGGGNLSACLVWTQLEGFFVCVCVGGGC